MKRLYKIRSIKSHKCQSDSISASVDVWLYFISWVVPEWLPAWHTFLRSSQSAWTKLVGRHTFVTYLKNQVDGCFISMQLQFIFVGPSQSGTEYSPAKLHKNNLRDTWGHFFLGKSYEWFHSSSCIWFLALFPLPWDLCVFEKPWSTLPVLAAVSCHTHCIVLFWHLLSAISTGQWKMDCVGYIFPATISS